MESNFVILRKMPCGCVFSHRKAAILNWLLTKKWYWLFDLIHGPVHLPERS